MKLWKWIAGLAAGIVLTAAMSISSFAADSILENSRDVLIFPVAGYADTELGQSLENEMDRIFRIPYYEKMDTSMYLSKATPTNLQSIGEESGADIVVLPVVTRWSQYIIPSYWGFDRDPIIRTSAVIDVYSWKPGESVRDDRVTYYGTDEAGLVRNNLIAHEMITKLQKKFPYDRVPKDLDSSTGTTENTTKSAETKY